MIQSQIVTPPLAAIEGTTLRLNTATTKSRTRSQRPRTRLRCGSFRLGRCSTTLTLREIDLARQPARRGMRRPAVCSCVDDLVARRTASCGSFCASARAGAISAKTARCLSMSASVCCTEIVHCSSHQ